MVKFENKDTRIRPCFDSGHENIPALPSELY